MPPGWALLPPDDLQYLVPEDKDPRSRGSGDCQFFGLEDPDPIPIIIRPLGKHDINLFRLIKWRKMNCIHEYSDGVLVIRHPTKIEDIIEALTTHPRLTGLDIFQTEHEIKDRWGRRRPIRLCPTCERWNFDYKYTPDPCPDCKKLRKVTEKDADWGNWYDTDGLMDNR